MDDVSALQVGAGAFGMVSISALLMVMLQRCKDYYPALAGRSAMAAVDTVSAIAAALVLYQVGVDWRDGATWVALLLGTLSLGIITRGHYASLFHIKVEGMPVSSEASVPAAAVNDPQQPDDARPLTDAELRIARGRP